MAKKTTKTKTKNTNKGTVTKTVTKSSKKGLIIGISIAAAVAVAAGVAVPLILMNKDKNNKPEQVKFLLTDEITVAGGTATVNVDWEPSDHKIKFESFTFETSSGGKAEGVTFEQKDDNRPVPVTITFDDDITQSISGTLGFTYGDVTAKTKDAGNIEVTIPVTYAVNSLESTDVTNCVVEFDKSSYAPGSTVTGTINPDADYLLPVYDNAIFFYADSERENPIFDIPFTYDNTEGTFTFEMPEQDIYVGAICHSTSKPCRIYPESEYETCPPQISGTYGQTVVISFTSAVPGHHIAMDKEEFLSTHYVIGDYSGEEISYSYTPAQGEAAATGSLMINPIRSGYIVAGSAPTGYTLTYHYLDGETPDYIEIYGADDPTVRPAIDPTYPDNKYTFDNWFVDEYQHREDCIFTFGNLLTEDTDVYAHWDKTITIVYNNTLAGEDDTPSVLSYTDVFTVSTVTINAGEQKQQKFDKNSVYSDHFTFANGSESWDTDLTKNIEITVKRPNEETETLSSSGDYQIMKDPYDDAYNLYFLDYEGQGVNKITDGSILTISLKPAQ